MKQTVSSFNSWSVNFNKVKSNTSLFVLYTGMMGTYTYLTSQWSCLRISILFNHTQCSPTPITSGSALWKDDSGGVHTLSSAAISGECNGLPSGSTTVTVKAENVCATASTSYHHGDRAGMNKPTTYSLRVEEFCR